MTPVHPSLLLSINNTTLFAHPHTRARGDVNSQQHNAHELCTSGIRSNFCPELSCSTKHHHCLQPYMLPAILHRRLPLKLTINKNNQNHYFAITVWPFVSFPLLHPNTLTVDSESSWVVAQCTAIQSVQRWASRDSFLIAKCTSSNRTWN